MDLNVVSPEQQTADMLPPSEEDKTLIDNIKNMKQEPPQPVLPETPDVGGLDVSDEEPEIKQIVDEKVIFSEDISEDPPSPPTKKKKVPSAKQREHLKKAREKALATRRANAKKRKEEQEAKRLEREKKRQEKEQQMIEKEQKEYEFKKQLEEQQSKPVSPATPAKPIPQESSKLPSSMRHLSDEDIILLQQQAIENYEVKRKARKQKKKQDEAKAQQEKKVYESITKAVQPDPNDVWAVCFQ